MDVGYERVSLIREPLLAAPQDPRNFFGVKKRLVVYHYGRVEPVVAH